MSQSQPDPPSVGLDRARYGGSGPGLGASPRSRCCGGKELAADPRHEK